jgi:hypothetical protein
VLGSGALTELGYETGFTQRLREVTPQRLALSMVGTMAAQRVETIADLQRAFNALSGSTVQYKPFHNQLAKAAFPAFMRAVLDFLLSELSTQVLRPHSGSGLRQFTDILIQDGSSFAVKDELKDEFPGRFSAIKPAAVELHATLSLFHDQPLHVSLAPDAQGERDFLPEPGALKGKLILGDRGYASLSYCQRVQEAGGHYLIRFRKDMNPWLHECWVDGRRWKKLEGQRLHAVLGKLRGRSADLSVEARRDGVDGYRCSYRLVLAWNPTTQQHVLLATNLDRTAFSAGAVQSLYRLRWQVELLFKEWKSYANLHAFGTRKAGIAEGLIWANLAAALLKRHLAHATQLAFASAEISTRTVAMSIGWHLQPVLRALLLGRDAGRPLRDLLRFLASNAQRAHPRRDRLRGRLRDGLEPLRLDAALRLRAVKN